MNKHTHKKSNLAFSTSYSKQSGFSLIEIMVAALILSIGILGVVGLQVIGLKGTQQSYMKHQAMSVVQNLTERMRSNKVGVFTGEYALPNSDSFNCGAAAIPNCSNASSVCSAEDIATADIHNLVCGYKNGTASRTGGIRNLASDDISTFLGGKLAIACSDGGDCSTGNMRIEVNWTERELREDQQVTEDSLVINTRISQ